MDPAGLSALLSVLGSAGSSVLLVALIAVILVGLIRKWWVPGWLYEESERRAEAHAAEAAASALAAKQMSDVLTNALMRRPPDDARAPSEKRRGDSGTAGFDERVAP